MTDRQQHFSISEISPPNSQDHNSDNSHSNNNNNNLANSGKQMEVVSSSDLNSNGKRMHSSSIQEAIGPHSSYSEGAAAAASMANDDGNASANNEASMAEKEAFPGWAWKNKRALEEYSKTIESIVDQDRMIGNKYGDPAVKE